MTEGLRSFFSTLQHSKTEAFKKFWQPLDYLFMGHSSVNYTYFRGFFTSPRVVIEMAAQAAFDPSVF